MAITWKTTAAGRAAIASAIIGPKIGIPTLKLGSAVAYVPTNTETGLHGSVLHSQGVQSIDMVATNRIRITANIGPNVGDFSFGEVGLYLADDSLFAIGVLDVLQGKSATLVDAIGNSINLVIFLEETDIGLAITVTLNSVTNARLVELPSVDSLLPPDISDANAYSCLAVGSSGANILALRQDTLFWTFPAYKRLLTAATTSAGTTTQLSSTSIVVGSVPYMAAGRYLVEFLTGANAGYCRMLTAQTAGTLSWTTPLPASASGDTFTVWEALETSSLYAVTGDNNLAASLTAHQNASDPHSTYMKKSGGTFTGNILLVGDATLALHPITKQQYDARTTSGALTPSLAFGSGSGTTYFTQSGEYAKEGPLVFFRAFLHVSNLGAPTGSVRLVLTGLPHQPNTSFQTLPVHIDNIKNFTQDEGVPIKEPLLYGMLISGGGGAPFVELWETNVSPSGNGGLQVLADRLALSFRMSVQGVMFVG